MTAQGLPRHFPFVPHTCQPGQVLCLVAVIVIARKQYRIEPAILRKYQFHARAREPGPPVFIGQQWERDCFVADVTVRTFWIAAQSFATRRASGCSEGTSKDTEAAAQAGGKLSHKSPVGLMRGAVTPKCWYASGVAMRPRGVRCR